MSYNNIPPGKDAPNDIYVVIEIPANHDPIKYEIDKDSDALFVDRFMGTAMFYPANYGYIPNTLSEDGDPLDVLVVPFLISARAMSHGIQKVERYFLELARTDDKQLAARNTFNVVGDSKRK